MAGRMKIPRDPPLLPPTPTHLLPSLIPQVLEGELRVCGGRATVMILNDTLRFIPGTASAAAATGTAALVPPTAGVLKGAPLLGPDVWEGGWLQQVVVAPAGGDTCLAAKWPNAGGWGERVCWGGVGIVSSMSSVLPACWAARS